MTDKIKILFLGANPKDTDPLRLGEEIREIKAEIRAGLQRDAFEMESQWAARPSDLMRELMRVRPHIVHFSGHGSPAGEIILEDNNGKSRPVGKQVLVDLFETLKDNVRMIVLNSCFSRPQAEALSELIDYTVGASRAINDKSAVAFAAAFYMALANGRSAQDALRSGKVAIGMDGLPGADVPALMTRAGVNSGEPFLKQLGFIPPAELNLDQDWRPRSNNTTVMRDGVVINGIANARDIIGVKK